MDIGKKLSGTIDRIDFNDSDCTYKLTITNGVHHMVVSGVFDPVNELVYLLVCRKVMTTINIKEVW